jgi:hypothetical protein
MGATLGIARGAQDAIWAEGANSSMVFDSRYLTEWSAANGVCRLDQREAPNAHDMGNAHALRGGCVYLAGTLPAALRSEKRGKFVSRLHVSGYTDAQQDTDAYIRAQEQLETSGNTKALPNGEPVATPSFIVANKKTLKAGVFACMCVCVSNTYIYIYIYICMYSYIRMHTHYGAHHRSQCDPVVAEGAPAKAKRPGGTHEQYLVYKGTHTHTHTCLYKCMYV